jgi:hypothetical protein
VQKALVGATALLIVIVTLSGIAAAYFAATGSGSGAGSTGDLVAASTTTPASVTGALSPGGTANVVLRIDNPNSFDITLAAVAADGAASAIGGIGTCTTTGVTFVAPTAAFLATIAALAPGQTTVTLPGAASMTTSSESGCQNATFTIPLQLTVTR